MAPTKAVPPSDIEQVILEQTAPPFRGPGQKSEPSSCLYEVWTNGFVVIVTAAVFLIRPTRRLVLGALLSSMALYLGFTLVWPETSYLVRSGWVIALSFAVVAVPTMVRHGWRIPLRDLVAAPD